MRESVVCVAALVCLACGPIEYVNQVTRSADGAVAAARAAQAEQYAPYEYTLAVEYLAKAREEAAYADYQAANRFGRKATEAARKARELALARAADPAYRREMERRERPGALAPTVPEDMPDPLPYDDPGTVGSGRDRGGDAVDDEVPPVLRGEPGVPEDQE